jgi:hypothetical protein
VTAVDPMRERLATEVTDDFRDRYAQLPNEVIRELRAAAGGRPIACVNVPIWPYFGRDFSGHPRYVPANMDWSEAARAYRFTYESADPPDRSRWLDNLRRSRAALVVVGPHDPGCDDLPVEARWCEEAPALFEPLALDGCVRAYRVLAAADGAGTTGGRGDLRR